MTGSVSRLIALLLVAAGLIALLLARPGGEPGLSNGEGALVNLDPALVVQVDIQRPDGAMGLRRQADGWHLVAPYQAPADADRVDAVVGALASLHSDGVISRNPDKAALFEVDAASGIRVGLYYAGDTAPRTQFVVGKLAPGFTHTYISLVSGSGSFSAVHRVAGPIRYAVQRGADDWRDRQVLRFMPAQITQVTIARPQGQLTLTRNDDGWQLSGGKVPEPVVPVAVVDHLLTRLLGLQAIDFVDVPADIGTSPLMTLSLQAGDANPIDLVVEAQTDTGYRVVVDADPKRFVVATNIIQPLLDDPLAALGIDSP